MNLAGTRVRVRLMDSWVRRFRAFRGHPATVRVTEIDFVPRPGLDLDAARSDLSARGVEAGPPNQGARQPTRRPAPRTPTGLAHAPRACVKGSAHSPPRAQKACCPTRWFPSGLHYAATPLSRALCNSPHRPAHLRRPPLQMASELS